MVKIKGGCKSYSFPPTKRDDKHIPVLNPRTTIQLDSYNTTLRNPQGDGSLLYVAVEIDELVNGHYDFTVKFDGQIDNATIMNKYGDEYANVISPTGQTTLSFDITDGSKLPAALIAWTSKAVNVTYSGTGQLTNGTTTSITSSMNSVTSQLPTNSPTASRSGSEMVVARTELAIVLSFLVVLLLM